jgi:hypothetical protein
LNPKRRTWTESGSRAAKDKAERFERNVLQDDGAGDDFADVSIEEFAGGAANKLFATPDLRGVEETWKS